MHGSHDPLLVLLSIVIAVLASYTALDLAGRVAVAARHRRNAWVGWGALAMGFGIWSMHFTAMLAYNLPVPIRYAGGWTALSLAIAVGVSAIALRIMGRERHSRGAAAESRLSIWVNTPAGSASGGGRAQAAPVARR